MKNLILTLLLTITCGSNAQEPNSHKEDIEKDIYGIRVDAPKGVKQYAFRIGEWETISKTLKTRYEWITEIGRFRVYVADNGLTFIEEILDAEGKVRYKTTYDYIQSSDSWENLYKNVETGEIVKFSSKLVDGSMVETIKRTDNENNNTYTIISDNVVLYTANRIYKNGFSLITHVGIATKITTKQKNIE